MLAYFLQEATWRLKIEQVYAIAKGNREVMSQSG